MKIIPILRSIAFFLIILGSVIKAPGAPDEAAEGKSKIDDFLKRHIEAIGGENALRKITSRRSEDYFERNSAKVPFLLCQRVPNSVYTETRFPRPGVLKQGYDGKQGWALHPQQGGRMLEQKETPALAALGKIHPALSLREDYPIQQWGGEQKLGDRSVVLLRLGKNSRELQSWSFDASTFLLLKIEAVVDAGPAGKTTVVTSFEDYRSVDGLQIPFRTRTKMPNMESLLQFETVKQNVAFEDALFMAPF